MKTMEFSEVADLFKRDAPVIICGSFVSSYHPTNIPNGKALTNVLFDILFQNNPLVNNVLGKEEIDLIQAQYSTEPGVPFEMAFDCCPFIDQIKLFFKEYFGLQRYNDIHRLLINLVRQGRVSSIITPNYDNCLSQAAYDFSELRMIFYEEQYSMHDSSPVCFYVHGSVDDKNHKNIVMTLTDEKLMPAWKRELLQEILKDRIVLLIGYSGRDYEICPELAMMLQSGQLKGVLWNTKDTADNENMRLIFETGESVSRQCYWLKGDLVELLNTIFYACISPPTGDRLANTMLFSDGIGHIIGHSSSQTIKWVCGILINMGCVVQASRLLKYHEGLFAGDKTEGYCLLMASCLYKQGKYASAARFYIKAMSQVRKQKKSGSINIIPIMIDLSDNYRTGKWYIKAVAWMAVSTISLLILKLIRSKDRIEMKRLGSRLLYRYAVASRNVVQKLKIKMIFDPLFRKIYIIGMKAAVESGDRMLQQNYELEIETMQMDKGNWDLLPARYKAKNSVRGYGELGSFFEYAISERRRLTNKLHGSGMLEKQEIMDCLNLLSHKCFEYGIYPEA